MSVSSNNSFPCRGEVDAKRRVGGRQRYSRSKEQTNFARSLRRNMTDAENRLWLFLKQKQLDGLTFRRQHPIDKYVVDFWCSSLKLVIELDGGQHGMPTGIKKDNIRCAFLKERGITILRFWNTDVMKNTAGVLETIHRTVLGLQNSRQTPTLTLPPAGGGKLKGVDR